MESSGGVSRAHWASWVTRPGRARRSASFRPVTGCFSTVTVSSSSGTGVGEPVARGPPPSLPHRPACGAPRPYGFFRTSSSRPREGSCATTPHSSRSSLTAIPSLRRTHSESTRGAIDYRRPPACINRAGEEELAARPRAGQWLFCPACSPRSPRTARPPPAVSRSTARAVAGAPHRVREYQAADRGRVRRRCRLFGERVGPGGPASTGSEKDDQQDDDEDDECDSADSDVHTRSPGSGPVGASVLPCAGRAKLLSLPSNLRPGCRPTRPAATRVPNLGSRGRHRGVAWAVAAPNGLRAIGPGALVLGLVGVLTVVEPIGLMRWASG